MNEKEKLDYFQLKAGYEKIILKEKREFLRWVRNRVIVMIAAALTALLARYLNEILTKDFFSQSMARVVLYAIVVSWPYLAAALIFILTLIVIPNLAIYWFKNRNIRRYINEELKYK